jgi:hypothetical protein
MLRNEGVFRSLDEKPYDSFYLYTETMIDHPVARVWPHILDIGSWMSAHRLETIAGERGRVGHFERVYPQSASNGPAPRYHLYGVAEVIPEQLIVLEVFPEKGGSYGNARERVSFNTISLVSLGDRTRVGYQMIDVHLGQGGDEFRSRRKLELEGVRELLRGYFENLRQHVERGR